jgi:hypothetical protein
VVLFTLAYSFLRVAFYHWYVTPIVFGLMILGAAGVAGAVELTYRVTRRWAGPYSRWVYAVLVVLCLAVLSPGLYAQFKYAARRASGLPWAGERLYEQAGHWLEANTPPTARVGYFEVGVIGFYSRRPIVDPLGLVTPDTAIHVASRDFTWAYEHYRPDYILVNQLGPVAQVTELPWFQQEYCQIASLSELGYPSPLRVYERRASCP